MMNLLVTSYVVIVVLVVGWALELLRSYKHFKTVTHQDHLTHAVHHK